MDIEMAHALGKVPTYDDAVRYHCQGGKGYNLGEQDRKLPQ